MSEQYRKKPVVIEAERFDGTQVEAERLRAWIENAAAYKSYANGGQWLLEIGTLEGRMTAMPGDWIIKGVKGEFYPCKPDVFAATYEPALSASGAGEDARERSDR